jgi:hypothetical protein
MDFDHLGLEEKLNEVSKLTSWGIEKVKQEINKCEVVCANCHRERTHQRRIGEL